MKRITMSLLSGLLSFSLLAPALAESSSESSSSVSISSSSSTSVSHSSRSSHANRPSHPFVDHIDLACMQRAVDDRDTALIALTRAYSDAWIQNLTTRRMDFMAAWTITDRAQRREALKKARKAFHDSRKDAKKTYHDAREGIWKIFKADAKKCRAQQGEMNQEESDS